MNTNLDSADEQRQSAASLDAVIEPAVFKPSSAEQQDHGRRKLLLALLAAFALLALAVVWFLFSARSVTFAIGPEPGAVEVEGGLQFQFRGVYLLRSGQYRVNATASGYEPYSEQIEIGSARSQVIPIELRPLPGLVSIDSQPSAVNVYWNNELLGQTPLIDASLPAGEVQIGLQKPRYQDATATIQVVGKQARQAEQFVLAPDWAEVSVASEPAGAQIFIDDEPTDVRTPGTVEVLTGEHEVKLLLSGFETFRRRIVTAAQEPMSIDGIKLNRADARLKIDAKPIGVGIVLNGAFQGQSPLSIAMKSEVPYRLRAFKAGYGDVTRQLTLSPGEERTVALRLKPLIGTLVVRTQPANAKVLINGTPRTGDQADGDIGITTVQLPTRPQRIEVKLEGYAGYSTTVVPKAGLSQELRVKLLTEAEARLAALQPKTTASSGQQLVLIQPEQPISLGASRREPGRRANEPLRTVTLDRLFYLGTHEVTNAQYRQFTENHDSGAYEEQKLGKDEQPAVSVTWLDAALYCNWLSQKDDLPEFYRIKQGVLEGINPRATGYRLPTEAEWGYAARQVEDVEAPQRFPWGPRLPPPDRHGNYADRSASHLVGRIIFGYNDNYIVSAPVGTYKPNALGLFDLGGNVAEWMHDFYEIPDATEQHNPVGPTEGEYHVIKGASWMHGTITDLRLSYRDYGTDGRQDVGFRIARYAEK
ncbi:MAG: PEGA domain-containing protein [Pseudomonadales bacterium]